MWHARKYPDCKTWTVFDDAGGGTIASKMTEANAKRIVAYQNALLAIADEAVKHHEHNPISGKDRLPQGYTNILNLVCNAIGE